MKFLHRTKKWQNLKKLCESDYYVLNYEQLLLVNGAGTNTAGSRKKFMQSEFETFCSDPDLFKVTKETYAVEGVYDGNHSYNDYDNYVIYGKDGRIIMDAIDVNRDGIIDYVK